MRNVAASSVFAVAASLIALTLASALLASGVGVPEGVTGAGGAGAAGVVPAEAPAAGAGVAVGVPAGVAADAGGAVVQLAGIRARVIHQLRS